MAYPKIRDLSSSRSKGSLKGFFHKSWWVALFIATCGFVYLHSTSKKEDVLALLDQHLETLKEQKVSLLQTKEDLLLQINSQSDPAWIQLTLMKGLGLVPEGQMKVYFYRDED